MKILHIDSSPKAAKSNSRLLSRYFIDELAKQFDHQSQQQGNAAQQSITIDYLDLSEHTPAHVTGEFAAATYTPKENRTEAMQQTLAPSDALCQRVLAADALVMAMPMHNWCYPSSFKTFIDNITRTGLTYVFGPAGEIIGQLTKQKVLFITTRALI